MSKSREAIDTIIGYYYQFDYFILKLLEQDNEDALVCIEGIEDIDIENDNESAAVQCKYYNKTEYNHSIIAKPIRFMLQHYAKNKDNGLKYKLYGHYKSGQDKLPNKIDIEFLKDNFLTYTEKKTRHILHDELGLTDNELETFISRLDIDINACDFETQENSIYRELKRIFSCNDFEAENYYYNNALSCVKNLSTKQEIDKRKISKRRFITLINNREPLFNNWFLKKVGKKKYCSSIRREYFTKTNVSPFERFFLIQCDEKISNIELKTLLITLSEKWGSISQRQTTPYCPYVYLKNISQERLVQVKKLLYNDNFIFIDGYDYLGADFNKTSLIRKPNFHNGIKLKFISNESEIKNVLNSINTTREIYQFYIGQSFYDNIEYKHIKILISETLDVINIL